MICIKTQHLMTNTTSCYLENTEPTFHNNYPISFYFHKKRTTKQILDAEIVLFKSSPSINP